MAVQTPKKSSALPWPALVPLGHHAGKSAISLKKTVILVGSRHNAHLHLLSRHVSKAHALILNDGGKSYIRDLASREQIYINGVAQREAWLNEGDLLKIGSFTFKFKAGPAGTGPQESGLPDAVLNIEGADAPLAISEKVMLIGRRPTCDVSLIEASVSTAHAVMFDVEGKRYLRDLGSRTGTWVNGAKIHQVELSPGDSIKIGETEMHYELAAAHSRAIGPAEEGNGEVDELEHLVGTARIDMVSEMNQAEPLSPDLEADLRSMFGAGAAETKPAKDDDLIELELAPEPEPAPAPVAKAPPAIKPPAPKVPPAPVARETPRPQPKPLPIEEPIELEPEADAPIELEPAAPVSENPQIDWEEIDLSTDPDVSDIPSAADTRALGMEFDLETPKPTLSPRVVDEPVELTPQPPISEQVLLDTDLHVSGGENDTADTAGSDAVEEELLPVDEPSASEEPADTLEATWTPDVLPADEADALTTTSETDEISLRGWQKPLPEEEPPAPVAEAPLELDEAFAPVDEAPFEVEEAAAPGEESIAPVDEAPTVEEFAEDAVDEAAAAGMEPLEAPEAKPPRKSKAQRAAEAKAKAAEAKAAKQKAAELKAAEARAAAEQASQAKAAEAEAKAKAEEPAPPEEKPKKRGRKSKKEKEAELRAAAAAATGVAAGIGTLGAAEALSAGETSPEVAPDIQDFEIPSTPTTADALPVEPPAVEPVAETAVEPVEEIAPVDVSPPAESAEEIATTSPDAQTEVPLEIAHPEPTAPATAAFEAEATSPEIEEFAAEPADLAPAPDIEAKDESEIAPPADLAEISEIADEAPVQPEEVPADIAELAPELDISPAAIEEPAAEVEAELPLVEEVAQAEEDLPEVEELPEADLISEEAQAEADGSTDTEPPLSPDDTINERDEELALDEANVPPSPAPSHGAAASGVSPAEFSVDRATSDDDFFSDLADTMPVLELDAAELEPIASNRDPDVLLALDQVDPEGLDEIEVIEPTEPTLDSAMDLEAVADQEVVSPQPGETSLTDSVFGRQIEEFSADSNGELIEDLPEIEEVPDADEELAIALGSEHQAQDAPDADVIPAPAASEETSQAQPSANDFHSNTNVTDGGIEPSAMGAVSDQTLNWQDFGAEGESVKLDTPGVSQAEAVLGGQTFVGDGNGQDVGVPTEEMQGQSFVTQGEAQAPPPRTDRPDHPPTPVSHTRPPQPPPPPPQGASGVGLGGGGGFVMGADLSSFIGGMPLVLPDLAPQTPGFGRAQVSFAGARSSWDQAHRPSFPMGQSLAEEMMDAAEGLRDAEAMDDDAEVEPNPDENAINDEGAPGDEWNVAGLLEDEDYPSPLEEWVSPAAPAQLPPQAPASQPPAEELPSAETAANAPAEPSEAIEEAPELEGLEAFEDLPELPAEQIETATEDSESDLPERESIDPLESLDESALASGDEAELQSLDAESPESEFVEPQGENFEPVEVESGELEAYDAESSDLESDEPHWPEAEADETAPQGAQVLEPQADASTADAELPILPEADATSTFSEDELLLELDASAPPEVLEPPAAKSSTINEDLIEDLSIEAINFDEDAVEPPPQPPRVGAIEEAVTKLDIEQAPEVQSRVDRTPPPPVAPAAPKPKAQAARIPPPPARSLRPRRGAAAAPAPVDAPPSDPVFGSLEHGSTAAAPYAGMPSVREVDVFSQGAGTVENSAAVPPQANSGSFGGNGPTNGASPRPAAGGKRPQRVIVPPRMGVVGEGAVVAESEAREPLTRPAYRVVPRRSSGKRVLLVVILMILCMGLAIFGIHYFVHPRQTSSGELRFLGIESLTKRERETIRKDQFALLSDPRQGPQVLLNACTTAAVMGIEPGFLSKPADLKKNLTPQFPDDRPSVMTLEYVGHDPDDRKRVFALLSALHQQNFTVADQRIHLKATIAKIEKDIDDIQKMRDEYAAKKKVVDAAPTDQDIEKLKEKVAEADQAYSKAVGEWKDTQLEVSRAREQLAPSLGSKPAVPGDPKAPASDQVLTSLQKSLADTVAQIAALKATASQDADTKRKALDSAIEQFQQAAAGVMKENPQLAQYVQAVQQLQEKTHKLGGDLIEVQQQTHSQLSNLKKRLDDQMQARRIEIWASDKGLSDLRAQLDLAERGYNAGLDVGMKSDSPEIKTALANIKDLKGKIEARKMTLGNDPMLAGVADDLQEMIKINQERLVAAQQRIEKDIKDQEQAFAQRNVVEQLPDTQRTQAAALKASQEHVNELRKQYALALDKRTAESNAALRELESKVADLNGKMEERKRVLASKPSKDLSPQQETQLKVALEQKQLAEKKANDEAADTLKLLVNRNRALQLATDQRNESAGARVDLETLSQGLADADKREKQDKLTLDQRNSELKNLVTIEKPAESDVQIAGIVDERWRYIAYSETGLAIVFMGILAMVSLSGQKHPAYEPLDEEELPEAETGPLAIQEIGRRQRSKSAVN
jgi:pSer/pThr/pTyr-binding forkhead associated (FHA) protein